MGYKSVVTTASSGNFDLVKRLGADLVIDYKVQKFEDVLSDFDCVLDVMGGDYEARSVQVLKPGGHLLNVFNDGWCARALQVVRCARSPSRLFVL